MASNDNNRSVKRKVRNSYIISTISISLVLFLLSVVGYLTLNALNATRKMREDVALYVMLKDSVEVRSDLELQLSENPSVSKVTFVSKESAAKELKSYVGEEFEEFLEYNPLPNSLEVHMQSDSSYSEGVERLVSKISDRDEVKEVVYHKNVIENVVNNIKRFNLILLLFGGTLLIISFILLNNTIRVSILSKRYIINTMKLVGATRWFIMKPFLWSAFQQGVVATLVSALMFIGVVAQMTGALPDVTFIVSTESLVAIIGAMLVTGVSISVVFTLLAVSKFLRMPSNTVYLY